METFRPCKYTNAVYKTADSSSTLQMSNRVIVEHPEQMGAVIVFSVLAAHGPSFGHPITRFSL